MTGALEDHESTVSIGGKTITNFRFADDIDGLAEEEEELTNLVERLDKASTAYGMVSWVVSWCFKLSQPQRITLGLTTAWRYVPRRPS